MRSDGEDLDDYDDFHQMVPSKKALKCKNGEPEPEIVDDVSNSNDDKQSDKEPLKDAGKGKSKSSGKFKTEEKLYKANLNVTSDEDEDVVKQTKKKKKKEKAASNNKKFVSFSGYVM